MAEACSQAEEEDFISRTAEMQTVAATSSSSIVEKDILVLRPGGLFWLDHFFCVGEQLEQMYAPVIDSIGFNKVKWIVGRKLDRGSELNEMYLSALLEKPLKNSW
ncbi:hypothetical protein HAX54_023663 [Datura stramonium]|uniref:Uncharacterized protein n=1 Tax=Datura stramonium TaxID=4076 RepID=A0ABS8UZK0_DATST|nr:hypothetical protein [Datura stramonium]